MMLQEPPESPYDLHFDLLGFPVRVSWSFWLGALIFGWGIVMGFAEQPGSPGKLALLVIWSACMFVSILIHELGHALAFRYYGVHSSIVLYHFGGLAIPNGSSIGSSFGSSVSGRRSEMQELWIAIAGPAAQLASAVVLVAAVKMAGYQVTAFYWMPYPISAIPGVTDGLPIENVALLALVTSYVVPSVMWAILNLVPIFPLDGGRIMKSLVLMNGGRTETWIWISLISAGLGAYYGFMTGHTFIGILFLSFAITNYQMLDSFRGRRF